MDHEERELQKIQQEMEASAAWYRQQQAEEERLRHMSPEEREYYKLQRDMEASAAYYRQQQQAEAGESWDAGAGYEPEGLPGEYDPTTEQEPFGP